MTPTEQVIWWCVVAVGLTGSALYSGLETGAYRLSRIRLYTLAYQGHRSAKTLRQLLRHPSTLLGTLLIGNNSANYLGTAGLAVLLEEQIGLGEGQVIVANTLIVVPILFVFGETLPKDIFSVHADRLMYQFARFLNWSRSLFLFTGLLPAIQGFSNLLTRWMHSTQPVQAFHPRRMVASLAREAVGRGLLSDEQSVIVDRVLALGGRRIGDEMVPWPEVTTVRADDPPSILWQLGNSTSRSRFPVVDPMGQVLGIVSVYDALLHAPKTCPPIRELMQKPFTIRADVPVFRALNQLKAQRVALAIVIDEHDQPVGVATVKDLLEPITGELATW